jgi:outer membrane receptor protein involved in Fe transport
VKVFADWDPADLPFGAGIAATWVGDLAANAPSGLGLVEFGDYVLVDLNARWYLDQDRKHRLGLRVENVLDEEYFSSLNRGFIDGTGDPGTPYLANNLGRGQSFHVNYTFDF